MMQSQSFKHLLGTRYADGINGVPTLVVGALHYCQYVDSCPFRRDCTHLDGPWRHIRGRCVDFLNLQDAGTELLANTSKGLYYSRNAGRSWVKR